MLVEGVRDVRSAKGAKFYFLRRIPMTRWWQPSVRTKGLGLRAYDSSADNPRDGKDVFDVYSKASGIGLNGIPYGQW